MSRKTLGILDASHIPGMSLIELVVAMAETADALLDKYKPGNYDRLLFHCGGKKLVNQYHARYVGPKIPSPRIPKKSRPRCGAKTRRGTPCQARVCLKPDGSGLANRCRRHGGMSVGPRSESGRSRIAEAQRKRWAEYRAQKQLQFAGHQ